VKVGQFPLKIGLFLVELYSIVRGKAGKKVEFGLDSWLRGWHPIVESWRMRVMR
jgi:hypothetical protein